MNRNIAIGIVLVGVFIAGIAGYYVSTGRQAEKLPAIGNEEAPETAAVEPVPEFSLADINGTMRQLSDWQGKARLVNFWATWCAPCRREIPLLKKTQKEQAVNNIQVIGIAVDYPEEVQAYAEEAQFNYPILVGQEDAMAAAEASGIDFIGMPFTMIIAPSGALLKTHIGEIVEAHIKKIIEVFDGLESGRLDLAGARAALEKL